jgi:hypothetical protein
MHVSDLPVLRALLCRASRLAASFCSYPFGYRRLHWMLFSFSTLSAASNDLGLLLSDVLRRYSVWCTGGCRLFPLTEDVWNVMNSIINRIPETKSRLEIIRTSVCPSPFPLCKAMTNSPLDPVDAMTQFRRQEPFRCKQKIRKRLGACHPVRQHAGAVECSCVTGHSHRRVCLSNAIEYLGEKLRDFSA